MRIAIFGLSFENLDYFRGRLNLIRSYTSRIFFFSILQLLDSTHGLRVTVSGNHQPISFQSSNIS
jgi:hypothetical protein